MRIEGRTTQDGIGLRFSANTVEKHSLSSLHDMRNVAQSIAPENVPTIADAESS